MPITGDEFRATMGHFASGITVVTSRDSEGRLHGMTVSAFCSVSLEPPLVSICIDRATATHSAVNGTGSFVVNVLAADQEVLSRHFSSRSADKFDGIAFTPGLDDLPVLSGTLANLECRVKHAYDGGDHTIFIGQVEKSHVAEGTPLLYYRGGYAGLVP